MRFLLTLFVLCICIFMLAMVLLRVPMFNIGLMLSGVVLVALAVNAVVIALAMRRDQNLHRWPAVTRCQLCDRRIWVWQSRERRMPDARIDEVPGARTHPVVDTSRRGSIIVHADCEGTPTATVRISRS